jgi:hypothetical protein
MLLEVIPNKLKIIPKIFGIMELVPIFVLPIRNKGTI